MPTKYNSYWFSPRDMYHNLPEFKLNLNGMKIGDVDTVGFTDAGQGGITSFNSCREGPNIRAMRLDIKFLLETEVTRPNCIFRYWVFEYNPMTVDDINASTMFRGLGGMNQDTNALSRLLDDVNPRTPMGVKVLRTGVIQHQPNYANVISGGSPPQRICTTVKYVNIPLDHANRFLGTQATGSAPNADAVPIDRAYGACVVAYDANNTVTTDKIGRFGMTSSLVFKEAM